MALKSVLLNNYLVNPSGWSNGFHEHDLLQEHHNHWIKTTLNSKNADFNSKFMQEVISLNIWTFITLQRFVYWVLGLNPISNGHSRQDMWMDIKVLVLQYCDNDVLIFHSNCSQPYMAIDAFTAGISKLEGGKLANFIQWTSSNPTAVHIGVNADSNILSGWLSSTVTFTFIYDVWAGLVILMNNLSISSSCFVQVSQCL